MPRRSRIHLDGLPLHIVQRGHNREACFFCETDYQAYLHWLGEALKKESCLLHAYCLMTNHVHLLLTPRKRGQARFYLCKSKRGPKAKGVRLDFICKQNRTK